MVKNLKCERIVVKAGTSILTPINKNKFSRTRLEKLGNEIWKLVRAQKKVVLVSSGAIALGMEAFGLMQRPKEMPRLQSCAAVGQGKLMHEYERFFSKKGIHTAQLLLTRDGLENRTRSLLARQTLEELLRMKTVPIVNENDTIATEEIAFGDNDKLSVYVGALIKADLVIILSDVDGFYLQDGTRVRQVSSLKELDALAGHVRDSRKERTVGGMKAKLAAARVAMNSGIPLLLVSGHEENILQKIIAGKDVGTLFYSSEAIRRNDLIVWS